MLVTLPGNQIHNEIVQGAKECKKEFERVRVRKRLKIDIRASSTLVWYQNGGRKEDKEVHQLRFPVCRP